MLSLLFRPLALLSDLLLRALVGSRGVLDLTLERSETPALVLLEQVERLMERGRFKVLVLRLNSPGWGWATVEEWREGLRRIRAGGAKVVVMAEDLDNAGLLLASAADKTMLAPLGELRLVGVGAWLRFAGPLLEKLGLRFDVEAVGPYKSFGETFTRAWASAENREATAALVDELQSVLLEGVSAARGQESATLQALVDSGPHSAEQARAAGLVDVVAYEEGLEPLLEELLGGSPRVRHLGLGRLARFSERLEGLGRKRVAVVHLHGSITTGHEKPRGTRIAPPEVLPVLQALREDAGVQAVVLAIDSPGGSALASDRIWEEVQKLAKAKPVVAAMGDVAASGGYYIAAGAKEISARPSTITGSIGVVGGKLVVDASRWGVHGERVTRGQNAGIYLPDRPFEPSERKRFRERLEDAYTAFLDRISRGRSMPLESIRPHAGGRVWSGREAHGRGLVDSLGGLPAALERCAHLAGQPLRRVDLVVRPPRNRLLRLLPIPGLHAELEPLIGLAQPGPFAALLSLSPGEPLAVLPGDLEIR